MKLQEYTSSSHNFEECMKCTVCTAYCPVLQVNPLYPGPKQAGPDGERLRLKDPFFFNYALKYCLNCKRCEVACPSGVKVADLIQAARIKYDNSPVKWRDRMLASTDFMGHLARPFAPVVNAVTGLGVTKTMMDAMFKIDRRRTFPSYSARSFEGWMGRHEKEQAAFPEQVAYFHGCYVNYNNPRLGKDLVKVLNALGVGVQLLEKEKCCGIAMITNGMKTEATKNANHNVKVLSKAVDKGLMVLTTSSTCTLTLRDEYPSLLAVDNSAVRDFVIMATRFIYERLEKGAELHFKPDFHKKVAYHTPCHMEKLGWGVFSEKLLRMIPGVEFIMLDSACCGIAGTYGFKRENYEASQAIGKQLFDQIKTVNPDVVACDCETCKWQIEMSTGYPVANPISILAEAIETNKD
ncbi:MAG: anaerobic glycerol-3-phosphate dehydrogenase subunit C [Bacteroidales bacterium]|nr:anaerobic glycerol-3-phosphate dehydrogenase subunit C [Bacteroidales bacterium]MBQ9529001.1 anaerobic glycerol-3-phosphate dehydrogenase subunit C [Bacteroidales bacterium]